MIEKVGVYCRLSDEDRDKKNKSDDSNSIINQRSMCLKYASERGWVIVDVYSDDDFSGAGTYRPEFERLIRDCESGKVNLVLCKSQSRFSRDMEVIEKYLHNKFVEWRVRFVSIIDNADTNIESNKKARQINGLINEWYLDDLSTNIKKSLKNKREDGLFMGSFAFYGYKKSEDGHKLEIDPVASKVVKKIFELYVNGYGYARICDYLNNNNIPTRSMYKKQNGSKFVCSNSDLENGKWTPDSIAQILKNEVYIGNLVQGKQESLGYKVHKSKRLPECDWCRVENTHDPIIDIETWNKVKRIIGTHNRPTRNGEVHYLSKKVYCGCCGKVFMRNVYNVKEEKNGKRAYMQCKGNKKYHICSNKKSIKMEELEKIILDAINDLLDNYYDEVNLSKLYEKKVKDNDNKNMINTLELEKNNLLKKTSDNKEFYRNLYEDKVKGIINEEVFKMMSSDYLNELETISKRINAIDKEVEILKKQEKEKIQADKILQKYKHIDKLNKIIIDEFIERIIVYEYNKDINKRDIDIEWNFEFNTKK